MNFSDKVIKICEALDGKKGTDISIIDISKNSSVADCFILSTASSITHARALGDAVCEAADVIGERVFCIDGKGQANWTSLDLGDIIVHVFTKEVRDQYGLEKMWADSRNHRKLADIKKSNEKKDKAAVLKKASEKKAEDKKKKEAEKKETKTKEPKKKETKTKEPKKKETKTKEPKKKGTEKKEPKIKESEQQKEKKEVKPQKEKKLPAKEEK